MRPTDHRSFHDHRVRQEPGVADTVEKLIDEVARLSQYCENLEERINMLEEELETDDEN